MIERNQGDFEVYCDASCCISCELYDFDFDFDMLREAMQDDGWLSIKNPKTGKWEHYCAECYERLKNGN